MISDINSTEYNKIIEHIVNLINALGPFIAALITGMIAILVVRIQSKAMLKAAYKQSESTIEAAKKQSEATIESVNKTILYDNKNKRQERIRSILSYLLETFYLVERNQGSIFINQNPNDINYSPVIVNQQTLMKVISTTIIELNNESKQKKMKNILLNFREDFVKGDLTRISEVTKSLETLCIEISSDLK